MTHLGKGLQTGLRRSGFTGPARQSTVVCFDIQPATLDRDAVCLAQQAVAGANLLINGVLASGGRANVNPTGGWGRAVGVYSAGNLSALTFTVYGATVDGEILVENIAGPNATTTLGKKAFGAISRVKASGAVTIDCEVGTINVFGLPIYLRDGGQLMHVGWNGLVAKDAATFVAGVTTNPATAITGDHRGTLTPSSVADGSKRLYAAIIPDSSSEATPYGPVRPYGAGIP